MIHIDRNAVACPAILTGAPAKGNGPNETLLATQFYKKTANRGKAFKYSVYSDRSVRSALEQLFHLKCAYCEFGYAPGAPMEVEHWRPKGEVDDDEMPEGKRRPGYYWLAAEWSNLFPSCIDCNRQRYHTVIEGQAPVLLGKKNAFPLRKGSRRASKPGGERLEHPLLLNPCDEAPEKFLGFGDEPDGVGVIRGRPEIDPKDVERVSKSIEVYALNRPYLVLDRKRHIKLVRDRIEYVERSAEDLQLATTAAARARAEQRYDSDIKRLMAMTADDQPYALLARWLIAIYFAKRQPQVALAAV